MSAEAPEPELHYPDMAVELKKNLIVGADGALTSDRMLESSFRLIDEPYRQNRSDYLLYLARHTGQWMLSTGPANVTYLPSGDRDLDSHLVITLSPLNDGPPRSSADTMARYVETGGNVRKGKAAPNSWGPLTKLAIGHELGRAQTLGAAHLQIYAPELPALTFDDIRTLRSGDPRPYGRIVHEVIREASARHRQYTDTREGHTQIHLVAAGMCGKALGAAMFMLELPSDEYELASVSLQNLSIGKKTLQTIGDYTKRRTYETPIPMMPRDAVTIPEPLIRREIDGHGAEFWALQRRIALNGLNDIVVLGRTEHTYPGMPEDIERIVENGVPLTITNAVDESLTQLTRRYLQDIDDVEWIDVYGKDGNKVGQMLNEHAAVMAMTANRGISRYFQTRNNA